MNEHGVLAACLEWFRALAASLFVGPNIAAFLGSLISVQLAKRNLKLVPTALSILTGAVIAHFAVQLAVFYIPGLKTADSAVAFFAGLIAMHVSQGVLWRVERFRDGELSGGQVIKEIIGRGDQPGGG